MPKENDADKTEDESSPSRRRVLQFIGAGAFSVGGLGGVARASPGREARSYDTEKLTGAERNRTVGLARRTSEFRQLRKYFKKHFNLKIDKSSVSAYNLTISTDNTSENYQMISFPLEYKEEADIVIVLQDGEFVTSKSSIVDIDKEKETARITTASVEKGQVESQDAQLDLSTGTVNDGEVSAQVSLCGACVELTHFICDRRCGLGTAAICAAVGLAGAVPGLGCTALAAYLCYKIDPSDCRRNSARALCRYYGYC